MAECTCNHFAAALGNVAFDGGITITAGGLAVQAGGISNTAGTVQSPLFVVSAGASGGSLGQGGYGGAGNALAIGVVAGKFIELDIGGVTHLAAGPQSVAALGVPLDLDRNQPLRAKNSVGSLGALIYRGASDHVYVGDPAFANPVHIAQAGGLIVDAGGLIVQAGGLTSTGGLSIPGNAGLRLYNAPNTAWATLGFDGSYVTDNYSLAVTGNLAVGTATAVERLEVNGNLRLSTGAADGARVIWRGGSGGTQEYRARVGTDGGLGFYPVENGATTSTPCGSSSTSNS